MSLPDSDPVGKSDSYAVTPMWVITALRANDDPRTSPANATLVYTVMRGTWENYQTHTAHPGHAAIAAATGFSVATVKRALLDLRQAGAVKWTERHDKNGSATSNLYTFPASPLVLVRPTPPVPPDPTPSSGETYELKPLNEEPLNEEDYKLTLALPGIGDESVEGVSEPDPSFEAFYELYPRKVGRRYAETCWKKLQRCEKITAVEVIEAHAALWEAEDRPPTKIPHPSTWLNQGRWTDVLPAVAPRNGTLGPPIGGFDTSAEADAHLAAVKAERGRKWTPEEVEAWLAENPGARA